MSTRWLIGLVVAMLLALSASVAFLLAGSFDAVWGQHTVSE